MLPGHTYAQHAMQLYHTQAQHSTAQTTDDYWLHTQAHMGSACYAVWLTPQHSTAQTADDQWLHTQAHLDSACYAIRLTPQHSTAQTNSWSLASHTGKYWLSMLCSAGSRSNTAQHWQGWPSQNLAYNGKDQ